ncbi:MAG: hypothetical protein Q9165_007516 [Trypethelium subeluteriae]
MCVSPLAGEEFGEEAVDHAVTANEGALELRGPIVFQGYFNNTDATSEAFTNDGWFKTGDLATITNRDGLKLIGRSKELININGVEYLPHEVEGSIEQAMIAGISPSFVVCFAYQRSESSAEGICVVYQYEYDANYSQARMNVLQAIVRIVMLFVHARPYVLPLPPGKLQKTTLGKLSRSKIRTSLLQGNYQDQEDLDNRLLQKYRKATLCEPRNDTERTLLTVFSETLGLDGLQMSIDTPFLDTGITSVDLIRLTSECKKACSVPDISITTTLANATIRSLAEAIDRMRSSQDDAAYCPLVVLQPTGTKTPLWLIHPGIGEVLVFLGLVQYFPDRPIYALRARGFSPGEPPFVDLHEILTVYHAAIKAQQPSGPYAIAGYSYGSMLAFEIAKIMKEEADEVKFLGCFNLPPHIKERMRMLDWSAGILHIAHFCGIITEELSDSLAPSLSSRSSHPEQIALVLDHADQKRCAELGLTQESLETWTDVAWSLQKIGWDYDPSGMVDSLDVF